MVYHLLLRRQRCSCTAPPWPQGVDQSPDPGTSHQHNSDAMIVFMWFNWIHIHTGYSTLFWGFQRGTCWLPGCFPSLWKLLQCHFEAALHAPEECGMPKSWMVYMGKSQSKMDDDWGYPYSRKPTNEWDLVTCITKLWNITMPCR